MSTYTKAKVSSVSMVHSLREVTAWTLGELAFLIQQVYDACSAVLNQICDEEDTKENHFLTQQVTYIHTIFKCEVQKHINYMVCPLEQ